MAASCIDVPEEESSLLSVSDRINFEEDWIIGSGCSNHMARNKEKLKDVTEYKRRRVVVTANNTKLPITHVGKTMLSPRFNNEEVQLLNVYHVPGLKKNLLSVLQMARSGNFVVFGLDDVKVYRKITVIGDPIMEGRQVESVYVMSAQEAYIDKTRKNEMADLWHARLGHVSYYKLKVMMKKSLLKDQLRSKFDKKAIRCIFVGYDNERKGWRCCDPTIGKCYVSRNVVFDEALSWWPSEAILTSDLKVNSSIARKMIKSI
ncbi:hypothetical protein ACH5RR_003048 [Cinchona calisaya]|uniref:GAG-pre-integrase domain-containing protein n=1 Tax=Cinchona calisaya TaxID=153742 RepID=A0ABD3ATQ3_9GENT